jgi:hypothetical protein
VTRGATPRRLDHLLPPPLSIRLFPFLFVLAAGRANAAWLPVGPEGGDVRALAVDPRDPDVVYLGTAGGGLPLLDVTGLATAEEGRSVFASEFSRGGLWRSEDAGETWTEMPTGGLPTPRIYPRPAARAPRGPAGRRPVRRSARVAPRERPVAPKGLAWRRRLAPSEPRRSLVSRLTGTRV